jgi:hypothetical protein
MYYIYKLGKKFFLIELIFFFIIKWSFSNKPPLIKNSVKFSEISDFKGFFVKVGFKDTSHIRIEKPKNRTSQIIKESRNENCKQIIKDKNDGYISNTSQREGRKSKYK